MRVALTIAGSDSGGGAGIQADLKAMQACGVFGASVLTAITAQNTVEVSLVHELPLEVVVAQIDAVCSDLTVAAVKTGMLGSPALVEVVAQGIERHGLTNLVVDPVMVSKSGHRLLSDAGAQALKARLIPLARLVTPNSHEAAVLVGGSVDSLDQAEAAAREIGRMGPGAVLVKGGHLGGALSVDLLWDGAQMTRVEGPRYDHPHTHGTGCTLASAIAAHLARGYPLIEAVERSRRYLGGAIAHGLPLGRGHGPTDHFWFLRGTGLFPIDG